MSNQPKETIFGVQFVVTRNGEPITDVLSIEGRPITLHEKHDPAVVWQFQIETLSQMVKAAITQVDGLAEVVPDARPVGLAPARHSQRVSVAVLKRLNRALAWVIKKLNGVA